MTSTTKLTLRAQAFLTAELRYLDGGDIKSDYYEDFLCGTIRNTERFVSDSLCSHGLLETFFCLGEDQRYLAIPLAFVPPKKWEPVVFMWGGKNPVISLAPCPSSVLVDAHTESPVSASGDLSIFSYPGPLPFPDVVSRRLAESHRTPRKIVVPLRRSSGLSGFWGDPEEGKIQDFVLTDFFWWLLWDTRYRYWDWAAREKPEAWEKVLAARAALDLPVAPTAECPAVSPEGT